MREEYLNIIREKILSKHKNVKEFCVIYGYDDTTIYSFLKGDKSVVSDKLFVILEDLGLTIKDL